jgi:hypothetical protein
MGKITFNFSAIEQFSNMKLESTDEFTRKSVHQLGKRKFGGSSTFEENGALWFFTSSLPCLRASLAMVPARSRQPFFFHSDGEKGLNRAPGSSFSPGFGPSSIRRTRPSSAFRGALGDSGRKKCAQNGEESSRASGGPDLSAREGGRRPHRIVFRASSSSRVSSSARCKSLPPTDVQPRDEAS